MTKRITISVPDDVAAHLEGVGPRHISGYVTDAIRHHVRREEQLRQLDEAFAATSAPEPPDRERAERFLDHVATWQHNHRLGSDA
ncbi:hypothetical protein [Cryptosporangium sp. NPDC051539]|uniref:hypothetical protein n=1 Tax=Cryptosporangium sp. NPDC051539 TaxID=3363962 RepID=UPI00378C2156